jgi:hypothetical protein
MQRVAGACIHSVAFSTLCNRYVSALMLLCIGGVPPSIAGSLGPRAAFASRQRMVIFLKGSGGYVPWQIKLHNVCF